MTRARHDTGQAFPIYLTVVAGLLFLALAYLAVGQAAVNRGGAQTAADAAALAAAQETRDQLADLWRENLDDPASWGAIFEGAGAGDSCWRADQLAALNDAAVRCAFDAPLSYVVDARTDKSVGDSIVPGTENVHATAHARAVIEPLCTPPETLPEPPGPSDEPTAPPAEGSAPPGDGPAPPGDGQRPPEPDDPPLPPLTCEDKVWHPEPDDTTELPGPEDLFDVHLADSPANDR
ncbi:pilus assembly protein TadG-related protein [Streptomyces lavenduligriseus]|uniref:Pilus assembly protein TadG-related protein n=1 Tax=Streptomyces lavenduligriseus TaxID=67315 RepID=A0ABT0NXF5_9ACTN|nr:pilus assembly protein TadG-related protein [Streptomyces lavenduligriseus]MCL3996150.1 pilus assembly protein TadG-related protein [Streptomyces lavenduligriseus]